MVYNRKSIGIEKDIQAAWNGIHASIRQMHPSSQIRPNAASDIFSIDFSIDGNSTELKCEVRPVVFCVPERANGRKSDIYVAVKGWLSFGAPLPSDPRRTTQKFGTQVGYFRVEDEQLVHVYGVHYDMDNRLNRLGHPVFHAQMSSQVDLGNYVNQLFNLKLIIQDIGPLLGNVRTPTAQMDAFSVITQIGADHLVSNGSSREVLRAFNKLRNACDFFIGAEGRITDLNCPPDTRCYRSTHWYT